MKLVNLDRPLDDLVKESLETKRADRAAKRKSVREKRFAAPKSAPTSAKDSATAPASNPPSKTNDAPNAPNQPNADTADKLRTRPRGAIGKKRRNKRNKNLGSKDDNANSQDIRDNNDRSKDARLGQLMNQPARTREHDDKIVSSALPSRGKAVKVVVSNLHPQVTQTDIAELFETVGPLKTAVLSRYANGTSACEAEVIFENMQDALEAIKRYNLVPLDNQPLQITLVTDRTKGRREARDNRDSRDSGSREANAKKARTDEIFDSPENNNTYDRQSPQDRGNGNGRRGRGGQKRRRYGRRDEAREDRNDRNNDRPAERSNERNDDRNDRGAGRDIYD